ncbi:hypothetical protein BH11ACT8_BH11ACT8_10470 [soil metagenome]
MSEHPAPVPYGDPQPGSGPPPGPWTHPAASTPPRPRRAWFAVGGLALLIGAGLAIAALVLSVVGFTRTEATVPADGRTAHLDLDAGSTYLLWQHPRDPQDCRVVSTTTGRVLPTQGLGNTSYTKSVGSGEWEGVATFDAGTGGVDITCATRGGPVQVGHEPRLRTVVGGGVVGLLLGILTPILLAVAGFVLLIVVGVRTASRPRRGLGAWTRVRPRPGRAAPPEPGAGRCRCRGAGRRPGRPGRREPPR